MCDCSDACLVQDDANTHVQMRRFCDDQLTPPTAGYFAPLLKPTPSSV